LFVEYKAREKGFNHKLAEKQGEKKPCQDFVDTKIHIIKDSGDKHEQVAIALAADGHGSPRYFRSDKGSEFAVTIAKNAISNFIDKIYRGKPVFFANNAKDNPALKKVMEKELLKLEKQIVSNWKKKIENHYKNEALDEDEKKHCRYYDIEIDETNNQDIITTYGSTLIAVVVAQNFWFVINIGDGWCVTFDEAGKAAGPWPYKHDPESRTDSLCQEDAHDKFIHPQPFGFDKIIGVVVITDGIAESFQSETYLRIFLEKNIFGTIVSDDEAFKKNKFEKELNKYLPSFTKKYSGDDVSIAGVFNNDELKRLQCRKNRQSEMATVGEKPPTIFKKETTEKTGNEQLTCSETSFLRHAKSLNETANPNVPIGNK
jgi:serine/threonine protein phosphatase PrpC